MIGLTVAGWGRHAHPAAARLAYRGLGSTRHGKTADAVPGLLDQEWIYALHILVEFQAKRTATTINTAFLYYTFWLLGGPECGHFVFGGHDLWPHQ